MRFLLGLSVIWLFLAWQYVTTMLPGHPDMALFLGLPPLIVILLIRFLLTRRPF